MARKYIDCRDVPQAEKKCTLALSADTEQELLGAAVQHAVSFHGLKDTPDLRKGILGAIKTGMPRP